MIVSILIISLLVIFIYNSLKGLGFIFSKIFSNNNNLSTDIYPLLSFPLIFIIVTNIHFFSKLYATINLSILLIGFVIYAVKIEKKENFLIFFLILFLTIVQFIGHKVNEDFGYYHLPYIINFVSDKIIFGLSHLSMVQGYNSAWLNVSSLFYLPYFFEKTIHLANSLIFFSISIYYISFIVKKDNSRKYPLSTLYALVALIFFIVKNSRLNSYGVDVPGHIYASLVFFLFLNFLESKDYYLRKTLFYLISLFSIFCILIKLSYIPLILFPIFCLFYEEKILEKKFFFVCFILGISWIFQQVLYTSCIIFPIDFTCFSNLPWYSKTFINDAAFSLEYINKSYWVYEGSLSEREYVKNFNWVITWFLRNKIELGENILTFLIPLIFLIILGIKNKKKEQKFILKKKFLILIIPIILGFILWFLKAPVTRYGIFYINALIYLALIFIFKDLLLNNLTTKFAIIMLSISILFNFTKNFNRILNLEDYSEYPFPEIRKIIYKSTTIQNIKFNSPISQGDTQSEVCWDTPVYCRTSTVDDLNIEKKMGYIIFTRKSNY